MITNWYTLLLGLVLGLVPPRLLVNPDCRYLSFEDLWNKVLRRDPTMARRRIRWWRAPWVWIDPVRGYLVATLLQEGLRPAPKASPGLIYGEIGLTELMLAATIWAQTGLRAKDRETISPVLFLAGMLTAMLPWTVWGPAFVLGAASAVAMNGFVAGYFVAALGVLGAGYIFMGNLLTLGTVLSLLALPVFLNWLRSTRMVVPVRY